MNQAILFHPCSRGHETSHIFSVAYLTNTSGLGNVSILPREKQINFYLKLTNEPHHVLSMTIPTAGKYFHLKIAKILLK
jgi:hypothetical protein